MFKLRPYQKRISDQGREIIKDHGFVYLAMQVRTGKTLTALTIADTYSRVLFVTKKKAIPSIKDDYTLGEFKYELVVINYESLHKVSGSFDLIIVDEAHSIGKFPKPSKRASDLKKRSLLNGRPDVIFLSGTPSPETESQLYHQLYILGDRSPWSQYKRFYDWARDYVDVKQLHISGRIINDYKKADREKIMEDLEPYLLSLTQDEAGFNSEVVEERLYVDMSDTIRRMYKQVEKDQMCRHLGAVATCDQAADVINKLHQLSGGTLKFDTEQLTSKGELIDYTKAEFIRDHFIGEKIAILYKYKAEYELLKEIFRHHTSDPEEFNQDNDLTFLGQIQSVREGVSLRGADCLVMYAIDFSAASYWQARARTQTKDRAQTRLYWIFARGLLDDQIYSRVQSKKSFTYTYYKTQNKKANAKNKFIGLHNRRRDSRG